MSLALSWFWFWIVLAVVLVVGEIFTLGFFLLPFGIGAAVAGLASWLGLGPVGQWLVFLAVSIPALLLIKRFADRVTRDREPLRVASDRAVGKTGLVLERIRPHGGGGRVRVGMEEWRAEPESGEDIAEGVTVLVLRVDGTHLVVRPVDTAPEGAEGEQ
jgi:membrane protein implicated in regulation of membrane protease activity